MRESDEATRWRFGTDPEAMIRSIRAVGQDRRFRLYALACCHRLETLISDPRVRNALRFADEFVETGYRDEERRPGVEAAVAEACAEALAVRESSLPAYPKRFTEALIALNLHLAVRRLVGQSESARMAADVSRHLAIAAAFRTAHDANQFGTTEWRPAALAPEAAAQANLLRDIFGDPFEFIAFDPDWRSANVVGIAEGIYADRAFDRLPILADALQEAGCERPEILGHCRGNGPHVRGCWVVDHILEMP